MNKKLIAAAIAAAVVAAPAAFAESTVYGKMHTSVDAIDIDDVKDNYEVTNRSSRLGFKGSEDLGGGLKAIYQIEFGIRSDGNSGDGHTTQRNTFVGLSGDWGTALVGRHDTPAKMAFYAAGTEMLGDSIIDLNPGGGNPIGVFTETRADNVIAYVSPNFSGFTFAAAAIPGEQSGEDSGIPGDPKNDNDGLADAYSLGAMYSGNGLRVGLGYEAQDDTGNVIGGDKNDMDFWQLGTSYTMNNFKVGAHYQDSTIDDAGDYTAWAFSGKYTFGNNAVSAVYTDSEFDAKSSSGLDDIDTDGWGLAAEHNFSKRTKVYAAYAANEIDPDGASSTDDDRFSLGMIHNF